MTSSRISAALKKLGTEYSLRAVADGDQEAIQKFALALPPNDILYLRRDITKMPVVEAWVRESTHGAIETRLVEKSGEIIGSAALIIDEKSWSRHVGEIRVLVADQERGSGLGRMLIESAFEIALDRGLKKIIAQMTVDQQGAAAVFQEMGFSAEALLKDHVQDTAGEFHDILIMSCNVSQALAQMQLSR